MAPAAPGRAPLTRDGVIEAALAIVGAEGAERLTMRRLGRQLGVDPMAVYHHLPNKTAVLDGIVEHLWHGVAMPAEVEGERWQDVVEALFTAFRKRLQEHPRAVAIISTRPSVTPAMLLLVDRTLRRLTTAGLGGKDAMQLVDCLSGYTIGKVLAEVSGLGEGAAERVGAALATVTPETHPGLVAAMSDGYDLAPDQEFQRGLRALIGGWT